MEYNIHVINREDSVTLYFCSPLDPKVDTFIVGIRTPVMHICSDLAIMKDYIDDSPYREVSQDYLDCVLDKLL